QLATLRESLAELPGLDAFPDESSDQTQPLRARGPRSASAPALHDDEHDGPEAYGARSAAATSSS
ncbi:MAG TPA: hypothetical protein VGH76_06700, partial [Actinomycetospora sp.]|uniref:hypothetical protein n=1 Tax=Actinomycetospora sp. TaxID=1872135 RepID=UPI002F4042B3